MINKYTHKNLVWLDVESPTREDVEKIVLEYLIDPLTAQELLSQSLRPKIETHPRYLYAVMHFPYLKDARTLVRQEVDFIISNNFIITTRYDNLDPIHKFSRLFEIGSIIGKSNMADHGGFVFYYMLDKLYTLAEAETDIITERLKEIETNIYKGEEKAMVFALSEVSRMLIDFRTSMAHHGEILAVVDRAGSHLFGSDFSNYMALLINRQQKTVEDMREQSELLNELRATNNSLLSTKQNEVTKLFTVMAFITFPLSLILQMLSLTSKWNPFAGQPYDFYIINLIILCIALIMLIIFKNKRWL